MGTSLFLLPSYCNTPKQKSRPCSVFIPHVLPETKCASWVSNLLTVWVSIWGHMLGYKGASFHTGFKINSRSNDQNERCCQYDGSICAFYFDAWLCFPPTACFILAILLLPLQVFTLLCERPTASSNLNLNNTPGINALSGFTQKVGTSGRSWSVSLWLCYS